MSWLPGYPHVGPGNHILAEGANLLDSIARDHDIAYGNAHTESDIYKADCEFLKRVLELEPEGIYENVVGWLCYAGIKVSIVLN